MRICRNPKTFSGFNQRPRLLSVVSNRILYCGTLHRHRTEIIEVFLLFCVHTDDDEEFQNLQFTVNLTAVVEFVRYFTLRQ